MSSDASDPQSPAFQELTTDNRGPVVIVASYIFFVITVIVVFTRLITRFKLSRRFAPDDLLVLASTVVLLGQTVAITVAVNAGLGRHRDALSNASFDKYAKAYYASRLLTIPTLCLAKSSANCLIIAIKPPKSVMWACQATLVLINVWALAALLAVMFECSPPRVWDFHGKCVNQWALYLSNALWNILTDLALIILPFFLMRNVQVSAQRRWAIIALFGTRIIVPAFAIAAAVAMSKYWITSRSDPTWHNVEGALWTQAVINLSIITACIPCIKRFLADLSTGMMTVNISEPLEMTMKNISSSGGSPGTTTGGTGRVRSRLFSISRTRSQTHKSTPSTTIDEEKPHLVPSHNRRTATIGKSESMDGLTDGVIMHTIDYEVNYEQERNSGKWDEHSDKIENAPSHTSGSLTSARAVDHR